MTARSSVVRRGRFAPTFAGRFVGSSRRSVGESSLFSSVIADQTIGALYATVWRFFSFTRCDAHSHFFRRFEWLTAKKKSLFGFFRQKKDGNLSIRVVGRKEPSARVANKSIRFFFAEGTFTDLASPRREAIERQAIDRRPTAARRCEAISRLRVNRNFFQATCQFSKV